MDNRMTITRKKWEEKQLDGRFKQLINNISHDRTWTWLTKGNFKRWTESLLIAAQNNAVITDHIKAKIYKTQQNSKCRLCGDKDETINRIINKCSKLAQQEYKSRHNWVGRVIHWEICKKFKFHHTNRWYMHNQKTTHINSFGTLTYRWITSSLQEPRPNNNQHNKKKIENLQNCRLCCPGWPQKNTERMGKEGLVPQPCEGFEKTIEHENDNYTTCDWCFWYSN